MPILCATTLYAALGLLELRVNVAFGDVVCTVRVIDIFFRIGRKYDEISAIMFLAKRSLLFISLIALFVHERSRAHCFHCVDHAERCHIMYPGFLNTCPEETQIGC